MNQIFSPVITIIFLLLNLSNLVLAENFIAKMDQSKWALTNKSNLLCEFTHTIPRFGTAVFYQEPARPLRLRLETKKRFEEGTEVSFKSVSAYWKTPRIEENLATIYVNENESFDVGEPHSRRAFIELQEGSFPSFFFFSRDDSKPPLGVALSTVRFKQVVDQFQDCVADLYYHNFEDVNVAYIHFELDEEFPIAEEDVSALRDMLAYAEQDKAVSRFLVTGHADERGKTCYNDTLSMRRAIYVYDLVSSDLDKQHVDYQFLGESQPLDKRKNEKAWAKNRRVKIEMFRD